jgi:glycosyltransferase involved in cell wall biosynthesis
MSLDCLHLVPNWLPSGEQARLLAWATQSAATGLQHAVCAVEPDGEPPIALRQTDWQVLALPKGLSRWSRYRQLARLLREYQPRHIALWNLADSLAPWICRWVVPQATWWASFNRAAELPGESLPQRWLWQPLRMAWTELPVEKYKADCDYHVWPWLAVESHTPQDFDRARFRDEWRARLNIEPTTKLLLTVGPLTNDKRIHEQFWSVEQAGHVIPEMHLTVIGTGSDLARLRHYARLYHIEERVHFLEDVPDVAPYYHAADLYLSTDNRLELSWSTRTAIGAGCPVIAYDRPWHREVIEPRVTGDLVNDKYPAELSRAIVRWFTNHPTNAEQPVVAPPTTADNWSAIWEKCATFMKS